MFFLAALRKGSCSIHHVRFLLRAEALFRRTMVHDSGLKPSLSRSTFPIAPEKVFATRLRLRMNLGPRPFCCTPRISDTSIPQKALPSTISPVCDLVRSVNFGAVKFETAFTDGSPVIDICAFAKDHDVDLIVTSTHGFTGFTHVLIGSTAEQMVRHAPCSVLVVPSHPHVRAANLAKSAGAKVNTRVGKPQPQQSCSSCSLGMT